MSLNFNPPLHERSTEELLTILVNEKEWQRHAVKLAKKELVKRNISKEKILQAQYLESQKIKLDNLKKAKEGYNFFDFFFNFFPTMFELLVANDLRNEGYIRKAKQQLNIRIAMIIICFIILLIMAI